MSCENCQVNETKQVKIIVLPHCNNTAGAKNEGKSNYVIENKCSKNV
jgi:hypothetical protein